MSDAYQNLKVRVRAFWQANPCGVKFADAEPGTRRFYELVEAHRYATEWHIPSAAGFAAARGLKVLEIGCGLGTDGAQFAKSGADYTGVDLTDAAVELARRRFELFDLPGNFQTADAENLDFPDESFDLVYSHGVLHHTPDPAKAIREIHRVLRLGGRAVVSGVSLVHKLTGEPLDKLREHARLLRTQKQSYLSDKEFLSQNTDGAGNPLARVYSRREAGELFREFSEVTFKTYFLNKRRLPLVGKLMPRSLESQLASRWGWHLWIYASK